MTQRMLVAGAAGQLGHELTRALAPLGPVTALDRRGLDLLDPAQIRAVVRQHRPAVIVNAAAYTAVDRAESEPELADRINHQAAAVLAEEAAAIGALLVHFSTDYVYDGTLTGRGYRETDPTGPLNVYGTTKLAGDLAIAASGARHWIFRVSWVYGHHGSNFAKTMQRLMQERVALTVVNDQFGVPTPAAWIADVVAVALSRTLAGHGVTPGAGGAVGPGPDDAGQFMPSGIYNLQPAGLTSWFDWAVLLRQALLQRGVALRCTEMTPVASSQYRAAAARPAWSKLDCTRLDRALDLRRPEWHALFAEYCEGLVIPPK